jgi:hypothetical protein
MTVLIEYGAPAEPEYGAAARATRLCLSPGLGIRQGGGIIAHPDGTLEVLRRPVDEFTWDGTQLKQPLLLPTEEN